MYVNVDTLLLCSSIVGALAVLIGVIFKFFKWVVEQKEQSAKIEEIQKEQTIICYALLAALDGLKQLGANGEVTKAHDRVNKHINQKAHDQK